MDTGNGHFVEPKEASSAEEGQQTYLPLHIGQNCPILFNVKGAEFVRRVRRVGRKRGISVEFHPERGKGSHGTLYFGSRLTVVRDLKDELRTGTLHAMLKQLGLSLGDLGE